MLYSFDPDVVDQVRGQLETSLAHVCPDDSRPSLCERGQAIHHFTESESDTCETMPSGVRDCYVYNALSGATQVRVV